MLNYQIISFNKKFGSIEVLFKNNEEPIATFNVDLQINDDGLFMAGEELDAYIRAMYPQHLLDRQNKLMAGIANESVIEALVIPLPPPPEYVPPVNEVQPATTGTQDA